MLSFLVLFSFVGLLSFCLINNFTFSFPSAILFSGGFFMVGCLVSGLSFFWFIKDIVFPVLVLVFLVLGIRYFLRKK